LKQKAGEMETHFNKEIQYLNTKDIDMENEFKKAVDAMKKKKVRRGGERVQKRNRGFDQTLANWRTSSTMNWGI
jgi:uridine kinase